MPKLNPSLRTLKPEIRDLLVAPDFDSACNAISGYGARKVINLLISFYCHDDPLVRWRSIEATGRIVSWHADENMESARVIMRRFSWMLNDESGGIGWGVPEAMGEVLSAHKALCMEYNRLFLSYIQPACNFLEHPVLQRGLLWGISRLASTQSMLVIPVLPHIKPFLASEDPYHRAFAALIFGNTRSAQPDSPAVELPADIVDQLCRDNAEIDLYEERVIKRKTVADLCGKISGSLRNNL